MGPADTYVSPSLQISYLKRNEALPQDKIRCYEEAYIHTMAVCRTEWRDGTEEDRVVSKHDEAMTAIYRSKPTAICASRASTNAEKCLSTRETARKL